MRSRHLRVERTARYHLLGPDRGAVEELWVVCHGYRQLARRFLRRFRALDDGSRLLLAPEALSRFYVDPAPGRHGPEHRVGGSWMTREDREAEIRDYVAYLDRVAAVAREGRGALRVVALGFSQGGHTAARWAVSGATPVDGLVLWGAYLPDDLDPGEAPGRLRATDLVLVRGDADRHRDEDRERVEAERLAAWGVEPRVVPYEGGHEIDEAALRTVAEALGRSGGR